MNEIIINKKVKRVWCCERCKEPIDINVPDKERTFVNDGGSLFCSNVCKEYKHIPVDPVRKKTNLSKKNRSKKHKDAFKPSIYKCGNCDKETSHMTWNKMCNNCIDTFYEENPGQDMSNAFKSLIRLYKVN